MQVNFSAYYITTHYAYHLKDFAHCNSDLGNPHVSITQVTLGVTPSHQMVTLCSRMLK